MKNVHFSDLIKQLGMIPNSFWSTVERSSLRTPVSLYSSDHTLNFLEPQVPIDLVRCHSTIKSPPSFKKESMCMISRKVQKHFRCLPFLMVTVFFVLWHHSSCDGFKVNFVNLQPQKKNLVNVRKTVDLIFFNKDNQTLGSFPE